MVSDNELAKLRNLRAPAPDPEAKIAALHAAMTAFDATEEKIAPVSQGSAEQARLTSRAAKLWREIMHRKLFAAPALAGLVALPIAGYTAFHLLGQGTFDFPGRNIADQGAETPATTSARTEAESNDLGRMSPAPIQPKPEGALAAAPARNDGVAGPPRLLEGRSADMAGKGVDAPEAAPSLLPVPDGTVMQRPEGGDRIEGFRSNTVRSRAEDPRLAFSIDVDTASYSFVRRSLKQGILPRPDTVRVEELINYFPYGWEGPDSPEIPFKPTVTVMPAPWNAQHKLMHVAIKGYDVQPAAQPRANLVFLIDVSGSMDEPDKLPLLKSAFRLLIGRLKPDDTIAIVTYAGDAGTVLESTPVSEKAKILDAIDRLQPAGSTAGEAGISQAYRLARESFVEDGVNRIMLATDGDFNVGQTSDEALKSLIEQERKSGVFLSVFGFGRGNLNDRLMQALAQNGNGTAAYIDTLQEAEKVLVQEAFSTLFPIAKDVKIQVEFNPAKVAEYRLIGYETRTLNREDFNNDRVDAGEIGSGHSVTAIYEITPKGAPQQIDDLRYGEASAANGGVANSDEYASIKIRYKLPDEDSSKLMMIPVTKSDEVVSFNAAGPDQRFSVAVAAFGQKLREEDAVAGFSFERIEEIAASSRGADPFGYRSEFLSLLRLASALQR
ncbi:MAG: VWA domain-containing protein [Proteobacteria bacterium]|nr:MAG: VWA domain-containing protein [Pseudomonadota bacterium]